MLQRSPKLLQVQAFDLVTANSGLCLLCLWEASPIGGARTRVATIFPNCYRTRRGFHLRMLQVTLSGAKLAARVGAVHEKVRPGGLCLCIHRREDQATWRLAREDARESPRNHTRGRP